MRATTIRDALIACALHSVSADTSADEVSGLIKAKCEAAGGFGTTNGMIPWVRQVGQQYVFNVGPEKDCKIGIDGSELWVSKNMTDAGTMRLVAAPPSVSAEQPAVLAAKGLLFYAASDEHGSELWVTDGTAAGTRLVKDIAPGASSSGAGMFITCDGLLYFSADDGKHGTELWASDGTREGTRLVSDLTPGAAGSILKIGECQADKFFFDLGEKKERWTSAGTAESTKAAPMKTEL